MRQIPITLRVYFETICYTSCGRDSDVYFFSRYIGIDKTIVLDLLNNSGGSHEILGGGTSAYDA